MITKLSKRLAYACLVSAQLLTYSTAFAKSGGGAIAGGGGDASEERVNEIRNDILKWINKGGAKGLVLPSSLSYGEYESKMKEILEAQKVVVGFVEQDDKTNPELQVNVNGMPKTCRGFISEVDFKHHILCNISRFQNTPEAEQYKLIHHEYAGLVNVENNEGAASDYVLSSQLTSFLAKQTVLRLAVKSTSNPGERKKPRFDVTTIKDMGKEGTLIGLTLVNAEDIIMAQIKNPLESCDLSKSIVLKEENLNLTFLCPRKYSSLSLRDIKFQYNDGSIADAGFIYMNFDTRMTESSLVKMNYALKDEETSLYGTIGKTKIMATSRSYEASYKVSAKDLVDFRGVKFDDGDVFVSENAEELANYINSKRLDFKINYVDKFVTTKKLCTGFGCLIVSTKKVDGEVLLSYNENHRRTYQPVIVLMKKGDITEYTYNTTALSVFADNKIVDENESYGLVK